MRLADMTSSAFHARAPQRCAIIPVGAVEPHGPHLPLGADTIISDYFARRLAVDIDAWISPTIGYGVATPPQRLGGDFPGVIAITGSTFTRLVTDVLRSLTEHGVRHHVLLNSAIDNISFLCEAARHINVMFPDTRIMVLNWWDVVGEPFRDTLARETGVARSDDHHAGMVESSLVMHIAPDTTRPELIAPDQPGPGPRRLRYHVFPLPQDAATPSGIVYTARKASAEIGGRVADQVARELAAAVRLEFDIDAPRP